uniref:Putative secreted protein n=1 Tax=Ixodes ricinus TaxID=34613 RepID=A0A6B0UK47_IXORI
MFSSTAGFFTSRLLISTEASFVVFAATTTTTDITNLWDLIFTSTTIAYDLPQVTWFLPATALHLCSSCCHVNEQNANVTHYILGHSCSHNSGTSDWCTVYLVGIRKCAALLQ